MTADERRASLSLAGIFALRMLGLFLVLPVFALEAARYPGGDDPALVGLAMGIYGLTQAVMQVPLGLASDRIGRKKVIVAGLLVFALGSALAALAGSVHMLVAGRALQGAGAVSAAVTALLADLTRDEVRTKAMALVGISIAAMFALSLMAAPPLTGAIGLSGLFWLTAALALAGVVLVLVATPAEPVQHVDAPRGRLQEVWRHPHLWRLDLGVFVLHAVQMAMWVVIPRQLLALNVSHQQSTWLYLVVILISMALMIPLIIRAEKYGKMFEIMRAAIALIVLSQIILAAQSGVGAYWIAGALLLFFTGFNVLEATQPSLLSKLTHPATKGAASGVYNTVQALGLFIGSMLGAWLNNHWQTRGVFIGTAVLALAWLLVHQLFSRAMMQKSVS